MPHAFITIAIPFNAEFVSETAAALKRIDNPFGAKFRARLAESGIVHFASLTIVPPQPSGQSAHLVIEMSADGDADQAIGALADALGDNLANALDAGRIDRAGKDPKAFIAEPRYRLNPGAGWFDDLGIVFTGTPGMTVRRILDEAELAKALTPILYQPDVLCKVSALERLRAVREQIEKQARFKPLLTAETAPFLGGDQATPLGAAPAILGSLALRIFWPITLLVVVCVLATAAYAAFTSSSFLGGVFNVIAGVFWALVACLVLIAGLAVGLLLSLRSRETADISDDATPDPQIVAEIMARENAVIADDDDTQKRMNEGRAPPRTDPSYSNYGGSWESYLEDFITKAHTRATSAI